MDRTRDEGCGLYSSTFLTSFDKAVAAGPEIAADDLSHAIELRNEAETLHNAGDHGASIEKINEALDLIGAE